LITAFILLPVVILSILKGGPLVFACLLSVFSFVGMHEYYRMALPGRTLEAWLAAACGSALLFFPFLGGDQLALAAITGLFMAFALLFLFRITDINFAARDVAYAALGFLYIPLLLMHLVMLHRTTYGWQWLLVIMLIVMSNDSAAYYTGSAFGKHRLYPLVSPKKSVEGALGGLVGSMVGTMVARLTFFPQLTLLDALMTAIFIGILGQTGDLFESMLKRSFGVKDSGNSIPGHGGVLDRLDSIIFAAPAMYYYVIYVF
jgi:phosphatidate cytidylyltransferase